MTAEPQSVHPATALNLPKLTSFQYRLYPVVDQLADKVCATMSGYDGRPSSREKDLVDIVVVAVTQDMEGAALSLAIDTERQRRKMAPFVRFAVPTTWGRGYAKLSRPVPYCADYGIVELAAQLASRLINPVFSGDALGKTWSAEALRWQ